MDNSASTAEVLDIFEEFNAEGRTVVMITHEADVAARASRVVRMLDGMLISDTRVRPISGSRPAAGVR